MIEVEFYYQKINGKWYSGSKTFTDPNKATRFIWKINASSRMVFNTINCDDSWDESYIRRRIK